MFLVSSFEANGKPSVLGSPSEGLNLAGHAYWCLSRPKMSQLFVLGEGDEHIPFHPCSGGSGDHWMGMVALLAKAQRHGTT